MTRSSGKKAKKPAVKPKSKLKAKTTAQAKVKAVVRRKPASPSPAVVTPSNVTVSNQVPEVIPFERMTFEQQSKQILNTFAPADMGLVVGKVPEKGPADVAFPSLKSKG